jgi:hypothetical protein
VLKCAHVCEDTAYINGSRVHTYVSSISFVSLCDLLLLSCLGGANDSRTGVTNTIHESYQSLVEGSRAPCTARRRWCSTRRAQHPSPSAILQESHVQASCQRVPLSPPPSPQSAAAEADARVAEERDRRVAAEADKKAADREGARKLADERARLADVQARDLIPSDRVWL